MSRGRRNAISGDRAPFVGAKPSKLTVTGGQQGRTPIGGHRALSLQQSIGNQATQSILTSEEESKEQEGVETSSESVSIGGASYASDEKGTEEGSESEGEGSFEMGYTDRAPDPSEEKSSGTSGNKDAVLQELLNPGGESEEAETESEDAKGGADYDSVSVESEAGESETEDAKGGAAYDGESEGSGIGVPVTEDLKGEADYEGASGESEAGESETEDLKGGADYDSVSVESEAGESEAEDIKGGAA